MDQVKATLALETGRVFSGRAFGAVGETSGEVVFCTSFAGYQEILTDPSYRRQIVVMTTPHIGNYGTHPTLNESQKPTVAGFAAREFSATASHWRKVRPLGDFMKKHGVVGIDGIDTRALTRHLRSRGTCRGVLATGRVSPASLVRRARSAPSVSGVDLAREVTCRESYVWTENGGVARRNEETRSVVVMDFGVKQNILRSLVRRGCRVTVVPAHASADEILERRPDGVMLSNGPGDPAAVTYAVDTVASLVSKSASRTVPLPLFGICLGHQILGLALGAKTFKLKFGHRGGNHPVKDLTTGRVEVTTQNHGFSVEAGSLPLRDVETTHVNLNDGTLEGLRHKKLPVFSVQHHPEAFPGPHDAGYLFDRFTALMKKRRP